ncbi:MAG: hypothetical protein GWO20_03510 [Candidatus Korarchaeota archaeon]|nr:hypothetical protein [Candidatus Korarchaeota archaeon]NIU81941.1 hypothetical protein [Candidatus Thorarchaeota archaeon]NIW12399.1 hypothetical protein [Candidatus Thorarchaeota archaeon]NIW51191.1 hypothetical protein [Candidatus Korarchaeota archaeon]
MTESNTPYRAFDIITDEVGFKPLTVGLYRIMTSNNPVLVLEDERMAQLFEVVIKKLIIEDDVHFMSPNAAKNPALAIIDRDSYKENWKKYSGREICIVKEEATVKNPGVTLLMDTLLKSHAKPYKNHQDISGEFLDSIHQKIHRVTTTVNQIKEIMHNKSLLKKERKKQLKTRFQQELASEQEKKLVFHILELLQDKLKMEPISLNTKDA